MSFDLYHSMTLIIPEIILCLGALILLPLGAFLQGPRAWSLMGYLCLFFFGLALIAAMSSGTGVGFGGQVAVTSISSFFRQLVMVFGLAGAYLIHADLERDHDLRRTETSVLVLLSVCGMSLMVSSGSLMTLYMGLELQSLSLYVLAATKRDSLKASEAGLKYFVLGALSSGILLYGISFVYGATGSFTYSNIATVQVLEDNMLVLGMSLVILGLAFKVSLVPFHMWTPDVYEGAPIGVTAFFAAAPKIAAIGVFAVLLREVFPTGSEIWLPIVGVLAVASTWWGALGAMRQQNLKRILAYSSIANMGFCFLGFLNGVDGSSAAVITYAAIYGVMTIGTFAAISSLQFDGRVVQDREQLNGLALTHPRMALVLAILMFSLAGIPPLAGFFAKFAVFMAVLESGLIGLAVLAILASVLGSFYYLRIVVGMYMYQNDDQLVVSQPKMVAALGAILVSIMAFAPWVLFDSIDAIAKIVP
jgi:NADH-quinone oxidoreductase subunit N